MARPNKGLGHVAKLQGAPQSKRRLRAILGTLTKEWSVDVACRELGIGPTHFDALRTRVLQGALDSLAPRPVGRPRRAANPSVEEVEGMEQRIAELQERVVLLETRLELASVLAMPVSTHRSKSRAPCAASG